MPKLSKSEAEIIEAFEYALTSSPKGYELAFIAGWLKAKHPQLSELIQKIDPKSSINNPPQIAI